MPERESKLKEGAGGVRGVVVGRRSFLDSGERGARIESRRGKGLKKGETAG
jgi:hypothetical protein